MLRIEHLVKTYKGGKRAVDDLSLEVRAGDIFGFIGHNGAGKTTAIRSVVGVLEFDSGDIFIDGVSIKSDPIACKMKMAYIPDNPDLYGNLTGIKYLNFVGDIYGVPADLRRERIERYAGIFALTGNLGDLISSYSHGMRQKLAIIAALLHDPKLLVLDEPFVGLDPKASYDLREIIKEMCGRGGAVFFSTHVLETAERFCNRVGIIKAGKLVTMGDMETVRGDASLEDVFMELNDHA